MALGSFKRLILGTNLTGTDNGDETITIDASGSGIPTDGWIGAVDTWTYASATTFTISGVDRTAIYTTGTYLRFKQGAGYKYVVVVSSTFSTNTTVTVTGGSDYTIANSAITDNDYSYVANPEGWPGWFNYTITAVGFTGAITQHGRFSVVGNVCYVQADVAGTSNATNFTWLLPIPAASTMASDAYVSVRVTNNGVNMLDPGMIQFGASATSANMIRDGSFASWTASGTKAFSGQVQYEI